MAFDEQHAQALRELTASKEREAFLLAACRDAQDMASRYGWALGAISNMDPAGRRADDLGRAAKVARDALLGKAPPGVALPDEGQNHGA